ncbi:MAG: hypothetical protein QOD92_444 [Acidimicrobiaceae bacterium]|jgi:hypothetical protein
MQRTIASARSELDAMLEAGLTDHYATHFRREIDEAENKARSMAASVVNSTHEDIQVSGSTAFDELKSIEDEAKEFAEAVRCGAAEGDARTQLDSLLHRHARARGRREEFERSVERIAEIEADPLAYGDSIFERFPEARHEFSF